MPPAALGLNPLNGVAAIRPSAETLATTTQTAPGGSTWPKLRSSVEHCRKRRGRCSSSCATCVHGLGGDETYFEAALAEAEAIDRRQGPDRRMRPSPR